MFTVSCEVLMNNEGKWIRFIEQPGAQPASGKTKVWLVQAKDGDSDLGLVSWFGRWRGYAFSPHPHTVFERTCLRDIADFIEAQNKAHREGLKTR
jgi:hypothetical protein